MSQRAPICTARMFDYRRRWRAIPIAAGDDPDTPNGICRPARSRADSLLHNSHDSNVAWLLNFRGDYHPDGADRFRNSISGVNRDVQEVSFSDKIRRPIRRMPTPIPYHDLIATASSSAGAAAIDASEPEPDLLPHPSGSARSLPIYYKGYW